jgi:hypothetical protein
VRSAPGGRRLLRPKLERYDDTLFVVLKTVWYVPCSTPSPAEAAAATLSSPDSTANTMLTFPAAGNAEGRTMINSFRVSAMGGLVAGSDGAAHHRRKRRRTDDHDPC